MRITAQLIDAEEDHHLWSEKWDRTLEDIFDVQDEVSETIARRTAPSVRRDTSRIGSPASARKTSVHGKNHLQGLQLLSRTAAN